MPDLTTYLPLENLQPFFDNARANKDETEAWREQNQRNLKNIANPALAAFFKTLKAEGRMQTIPNSEGYATGRWNAWNNVAKLSVEEIDTVEGERQLESLASIFAQRLISKIVSRYEHILQEKGAEAAAAIDKNVAYITATGAFNKGNYEPYVLSYETCWNTGQALYLAFNEWVPRGCRFPDTPGDEEFPDIRPLAPVQLQVSKLELKTGNLLVADWFRIPEFTKLTEEKWISINSRSGCEEKARHLAETFNVVSVHVGNTSPGVYQNGSQVVVGYHHEDEGPAPAHFTTVGRVCTDLWAATFVEYENLIELVARTKPDTARKIVDAYLAEDDGGVYGLHKLTVEPGTYYLYHFGNYEDFAERAEQAGLALNTGHIIPYFVLSREQLSGTQPL